jgi:hydrogenase-4 component E
MNGAIVWLVVALGLGVLTLRRRSVAVAAVSLQALLLTGAAAAQAHGANDAIATAALGVRALLLGALLFLVIGRTRESRPVRADSGPLTRGAAGIGVAFALAWLVPTLGLGDRNAERAVLALVAFGLVAAATRRATVFQIVALVQIDNALALAALAGAPGLPALVELGVAGDLIMVVLVAALLHARIFAEFGSADSRHLGQLRD